MSSYLQYQVPVNLVMESLPELLLEERLLER